MARFDVYKNAGRISEHIPYLLDIQANSVDYLGSRVVIPLVRTMKMVSPSMPDDLAPKFIINGETCLLNTPMIAAVSLRTLKSRVSSLKQEQYRIVASLDFLLYGY